MLFKKKKIKPHREGGREGDRERGSECDDKSVRAAGRSWKSLTLLVLSVSTTRGPPPFTS